MNKTIVILLVLIVLTFKANAQITNSGFENWTTAGSYEEPTGWANTNPFSTGPFYAVTKSTDHYPAAVGNYSIRIENNTAFSNYVGRGVIMTGTFTAPDAPFFPITGHPTSLTGYYKFLPVNNDTLYMSVHLFKNGSEVAGGYFNSSSSVSSWTSFNIPITTGDPYGTTYATADSGRMMIAAYNAQGPNTVPRGNSVLYVDNLNFDTAISSVTDRNSRIPTPVSGVVNLRISSSSSISFTLTSNSYVSLKVLDLHGREVATLVNKTFMAAGTYTKRWNADAMSNGIYLYRIQTGSSAAAIKAFR